MNNTTLFLGDLPAFCTERDIVDLFSKYGEISEIKIMKSEETQRNLSYGFLTYTTLSAALTAMNDDLDGVLFRGRHLK